MTNKLTPKQWAEEWIGGLSCNHYEEVVENGEYYLSHNMAQLARQAILAASEYWGRQGFERGHGAGYDAMMWHHGRATEFETPDRDLEADTWWESITKEETSDE